MSRAVLKRVGAVGFAFFLVKGIAWLVVCAAGLMGAIATSVPR